MGQLRYGAKFVLIGGLSLVVILVLVLVLLSDLRNTMRLTENGLDGLRVLGKVHRVIEFTQQHRGLSSGVLNGNAAMREPRSAKEKQVEEAFAAAEAVLPQVLRVRPEWQRIRESWQAIARWAGLDASREHPAAQ